MVMMKMMPLRTCVVIRVLKLHSFTTLGEVCNLCPLSCMDNCHGFDVQLPLSRALKLQCAVIRSCKHVLTVHCNAVYRRCGWSSRRRRRRRCTRCFYRYFPQAHSFFLSLRMSLVFALKVGSSLSFPHFSVLIVVAPPSSCRS